MLILKPICARHAFSKNLLDKSLERKLSRKMFPRDFQAGGEVYPIVKTIVGAKEVSFLNLN